MSDNTEKWETIDWTKVETEVFRLQKRIFRRSKEDRRTEIHTLQQLLVESWSARCLAVRKAAQDSTGKNTPGIDGKKNLTDAQKLRLAKSLCLRQRPKPVRRVSIPKPGSSELRPLGIPTIGDRALQHLIVLALEPEWEARFAPHQFGFRPGRNCQDALTTIRLHIQCTPKWVLDADIEKFFDRLDHSALMRKLDAAPRIGTAINRILKSGVMTGLVIDPTERGTPQGGPLSPLLANIALSGLERDLEGAFTAGTIINKQRETKPPRIIIYADDFVVLHENRQVIEAARTFIEDWLRPLGLNLSPSKTRITHTLEKVDGQQAGFDFLGCRVQQFPVGKYSKGKRGRWTDIRPSKKSIRRLRSKCAEIILKCGPRKKRNAAYKRKQEAGGAGPMEVMVNNLNASIRGWCNYHRSQNAKKTFTGIDHMLFKMLWAWAKRTFPRRGRKLLAKDLWLSRGRPWKFCINDTSSGEPAELYAAASTPIVRHYPVQVARSYYDGDWAYWGTRRGIYPGITKNIGTLLKRQHGRCGVCKDVITRYDRVTVAQVRRGEKPIASLLHQRCDERNSRDTAQRDQGRQLSFR